LYDECEPAERAAVDAHLAVCPACAAEIAALGSARLQLASWTPPDVDLGFTIVKPQATAAGVPRPEAVEVPEPRRRSSWAWFWQPMPVWTQVAAACLIFAAGLTLGVLRGNAVPQSVSRQPSAAPLAAVQGISSTTVTADDLAALEQRLRKEMAQLRATPVSSAVPSPAASNAQILAQVRAMIDESEQRQQRELALRTAQVVRDFDSQRQVDLARIERNFGQIEGLTGAEVREQRQMLNYLLRVSEQR
jgi:anti-sigma factor RsiW